MYNLNPYDRTPTGGRDMLLGRNYRYAPTHDGYACQKASRNIDESLEIVGGKLGPALARRSRVAR
jgi:hypothetical protein